MQMNLNGHPGLKRLYTNFLSEGLIFEYQQAHENKLKKSKVAEESCIIATSYNNNQCAVYWYTSLKSYIILTLPALNSPPTP